MIAILGASGYVGTEFVRLFSDRKIPHVSLSRSHCNYYQPAALATVLKRLRVDFLINCAGYTGKPNVDACELHRTECLMANAVLPGLIAEACDLAGISWGHVSSGCIYTGSKQGSRGFAESDAPNFSFRQNNCSFYSGCKALGEECIAELGNCYIWRLRIPFDHRDSSRNYLSKVMRYDCLLDAENSLSHLGQFVTACYECWARGVDFGIYNLTNGGGITTRQIVGMLQEANICDKEFHFFRDEQEFMQIAAKAPRSNTVLDNSKALEAGLELSPVADAVREALAQWESAGELCGRH